MATVTGVPMSEPEGQATISGFGRVAGVFFSPKTTFADIARKPSWLLPVILMTILSIIVSVSMNQRVNWRQFMSQQIEKSPRAAQLSAEQKEQQIEGGAKITPIFVYVFGTLGPILFVLFFSLVMWGAYNLLGGAQATFSQSLAINSHAALPTLISSLLVLVVLFVKPVGTFDVDNPLATNLGTFFPEDSAKWLIALGKSIDVFTIWALILTAIGYAAVNPRKLKGATPYMIAFSVWAFFTVIRVGWAFIFS